MAVVHSMRRLCGCLYSETWSPSAKFIFFKVFVIGVQHSITFTFCQCFDEIGTLIQFELFPGTPKPPTVAFSFQLLDYLEALLLECQVAVSDFTAALKIMSASPIMKVQQESSLGCTVALDKYFFRVWNHCIPFWLIHLKNTGYVGQCDFVFSFILTQNISEESVAYNAYSLPRLQQWHCMPCLPTGISAFTK